MPHQIVIEKIREAVESRGLADDVASKIEAYLKQSESSDFPKRNKQEQVRLIFDAISSDSNESHVEGSELL